MIAHRPQVCKGPLDDHAPPLTVGDIALRVPPLLPHDSIARAAEAIRLSPAGAAPVAEDGRIVGVVSAEGLKALIAGASVQHVRALPVQTVISPELICLREGVTIDRALETFRDNDIDAAPVLDDLGRYVGMVGTSGLVSAACGTLRPVNIGGLATPLGVYLTNGSVRAGVGDIGLASAGVFIGLLQILASWCAFRLSPAVAGATQAVLGRLGSDGPQNGVAWSGGDPHWPYGLLSILLFGLLFRLTWVTGLHAAEHQVVHAIETGDELTAESVRRKPRVHPRCGTNLLAAFGTFMLLRGLGEGWDILAFPFVLLTWRIFGGVLQQHVTTRVPTDAQLANGIAAGRQLLERYQTALRGEPTRWRRLWNMGMIQVTLGFACLWFGLGFLLQWVPVDPEWLLYLGIGS
jgi:CBS domain-containing protein